MPALRNFLEVGIAVRTCNSWNSYMRRNTEATPAIRRLSPDEREKEFGSKPFQFLYNQGSLYASKCLPASQDGYERKMPTWERELYRTGVGRETIYLAMAQVDAVRRRWLSSLFMLVMACSGACHDEHDQR